MSLLFVYHFFLENTCILHVFYVHMAPVSPCHDANWLFSLLKAFFFVVVVFGEKGYALCKVIFFNDKLNAGSFTSFVDLSVSVLGS